MNKKKGNRFVKFLIVFFSICLLIFILLPGYVRNALLYQYPNIDDHKIFANRIVEATDPVPLLQSSQYNKNLLPDSLLQKFNRYETVAFIVVQNDSLIHESYYDGFSETSISNCFSATKSIVGLLIGFAIEDGYIKNLDQPVSDFIPDYKTSQNSRLTIRHLLTMSSGIKFSEKYNSLFSPTTKIYYGTDLKEQVQKQMVSHSPGMHFNYISINTQILGTVITEATGKTLSEYASEKLWGPLSASHDAHWSLDKKEGMEKAFCCFNATATDFARIGMLMCDSGVWKGQQVIPRSYYLASVNHAGFLTDFADNPVTWYGLHWWLITYKTYDVVYARGLYGQYIIAIPELNLTIVRLGKQWDEERKNHHPLDLLHYLNAAFSLVFQ